MDMLYGTNMYATTNAPETHTKKSVILFPSGGRRRVRSSRPFCGTLWRRSGGDLGINRAGVERSARDMRKVGVAQYVIQSH